MDNGRKIMLTHGLARRAFIRQVSAGLFAGLMSFGLPKAATASSKPSSPAEKAGGEPRVGVALGAGGANGLAHILMLEALDELRLTPYRISGSSIGAVIGALYASGRTGSELRQMVEQFILSPDEDWLHEVLDQDALRWIDFLEFEVGDGGLLSSQGFVSFLYESIDCENFSELVIPLSISAADLWDRSEVVFDSGNLLNAIKASMALPGIFRPVEIAGRVLIDGGTVNPVPYDLLMDDCDIVVAIDVIGRRTRPRNDSPAYFETVFNSVKVMQHAVMSEKLRCRQPSIYLAPDIVDVRALEFYRADEVFSQAAPAKSDLKQNLANLIDEWQTRNA
jgi:NTE family protein